MELGRPSENRCGKTQSNHFIEDSTVEYTEQTTKSIRPNCDDARLQTVQAKPHEKAEKFPLPPRRAQHSQIINCCCGWHRNPDVHNHIHFEYSMELAFQMVQMALEKEGSEPIQCKIDTRRFISRTTHSRGRVAKLSKRTASKRLLGFPRCKEFRLVKWDFSLRP